MKQNFRQLRAQQIDRMVQPLHSIKLPRPPKDWIRALREAMDVSFGELAQRLQANRSLVRNRKRPRSMTGSHSAACAPVWSRLIVI